jgi:natural product biosynthesis luciferase-like monooxygenase protein
MSTKKAMDFSLYYFASHEAREHEPGKYQLILESARWADEVGFDGVWLPERHFHAFGGLSPNPSVLGAALATITDRIHIRAGSVVLPLHDPIRVAEEWAVVDNLSDGRVGLGVAFGWVPNDFVISQNQDHFEDRREVFWEDLATIDRLWRGGTVSRVNPLGEEIEVRILPRPIQESVPFWITAATNPETFRRAGESGSNLLTHLLGQSVKELGEKIVVYRDAWKAARNPGRGVVTLMLHALVGASDDAVRDVVRDPMKRYLGSSLDLAKAHVESVPFLKNADAVDVGAIKPEDVDPILEFSFQRYFRTSGLFGTPQRCVEMIRDVEAIGVDEVACLIDYGVDSETVLAGLDGLNEVRRLAAAGRESEPAAVGAA